VFLIEIFKLINIPFLRGKENQSERKGFLLLLASNVTGRFQLGIIWEPLGRKKRMYWHFVHLQKRWGIILKKKLFSNVGSSFIFWQNIAMSISREQRLNRLSWQAISSSHMACQLPAIKIDTLKIVMVQRNPTYFICQFFTVCPIWHRNRIPVSRPMSVFLIFESLIRVWVPLV
jgi:hypothetical protein